MTHEEKVKIENYKEHYNSIMGKLRVANKELENILSSHKKASTQLDNLQLKIQTQSQLLNNIQVTYTNTTKILNERESILLSRENKLLKDQKEYQIKQIELESTLSKKKQLAETYLSQLQTASNELLDVIIEKKNQIIELDKNIEFILKHRDDLIDSNRILDNTLFEHRSKNNYEINSIDKELKEKREELKQLAKKTDEEREKIKKPDKLLEERRLNLERDIRNFQILTSRWKKFFEKHFPNQRLNL